MKQLLKVELAIMLISLFLCINGKSQNSKVDYDLSSYKSPYLKRHLLELNFDMNGSNASMKSKTNESSIDNIRDQESNTNSFESAIQPFYSFYLNSEKLQLFQEAAADLQLINNSVNENYSRSGSGTMLANNQRTTRKNLYPYLSYRGEFREFLSGLFFIEQDLGFSITQAKNYRFVEQLDSLKAVYQDNKTDNKTNRLDGSLTFLAGWGRIEWVHDARLAVYILDDLQQAGLLSREVNQEDIEKLAMRISEVQNERFFDSRDKRIWELQQIDTILKELGLLAQDDINYFAILNDNWMYSTGPVRESGFQVAGGVLGRYNVYNRESLREGNYYLLDSTRTSSSLSEFDEIQYGAQIRIIYEKPINLYWQFSARNTFEVSRANSVENFFDDGVASDTINKDFVQIQNALYCELGYYPNSRTSISLFAQNNINYSQSDQDRESSYSLVTQLGLDINYYISPRFRLDLGASLNTSNAELVRAEDYTYKNDRNAASFRAGLVYKIL